VARIDNRGNLRGSASAGNGFGVAVQGANEFYRISKALKAAGQSGLRKEFHKSVTAAAKPLIPKVREQARKDLPKHGKLNERIAKKPYRAQARTGAQTAGVRIVGTKVDPRINNEGRIQHPVFGRAKSTVVQTVPGAKGYFDRPLQESGPQVQREVLNAMQDFVNRTLR
jgi:hypothetical protein